MTGMREVAALARVSAKTVSRVYNNDSHVAPATRERVEAALRELNYVPNTLATTFRAGRAPVIGIAVPDLVDPFFGSIAKSVADLAMTHGMSIVVTNLGEDPARERDIVESLLRQSLTGLILAPIGHDQSYLKAWTSRTPVVFVDRAPQHVSADSFVEDDHAGAYLATEHLIEHGHTLIAFLGDTIEIPTSRHRYAGYRAALADHGIEVAVDLVALGASDRTGAAAALARLETAAVRPTALFSSNARCTMALVPALAGTDLAVAAFGDFPMADMLTPAITVIDQDPVLLGQLAGQRIIDRAFQPGRRYRRRNVLPVTLISRESCLTTGTRTVPRRPLPVHEHRAG